MGFFPNYKDIIELIRKGSTVEAQKKVMEFKEVALALEEENLSLRKRIDELESKLDEKQNVVWQQPFYWVEKPGSKDGPFCQNCYDTENKLVRLQSADKGAWRCTACKNNFFEESYRPSGLGVGVVKPRSR